MIEAGPKGSASTILFVKINLMRDKLQTVIFFSRHGETDHVYSADPNLDGHRILTERGRAEMQRVGEYLADFAPTAIYTSPTLRTKQCAEIIKRAAAITAEAEERPELVEVYSNSDYESIATRIPQFFAELIQRHPGQHLVCISHQDVIQGGLNCYELTNEEKDFPCRMGEMYRLTFAAETLVECQKLRPAHEIHP
jgi:broad specificity phosphatase PhoE